MTLAAPPLRDRPAPSDAQPTPPASWRVELVWVLGVALTALVGVLLMIQVWKMSLRVPLELSGDQTLGLALVKTLITRSWVGVNPDIGAPYGSVLYDGLSVFGDLTNLVVVRLMGLISDDPAAIVNVFALLTYPLVGGFAYVALRVLGVDRPVAAACALVFTYLPLHFVRGLSHAFLAAYYAVPVAGVLILGLLGRVTLFARRPAGHGPWAWASRRTLLTLVACLFVGVSGSYYSFFTLVLAAPLGLLAALGAGSWRRAAATFAVCGTVAASMFAVQLPAIIYWHENGGNPSALVRSSWESEFYGLRLTEMLLPLPNHRIAEFGEFSRHYIGVTQLGSEGPTMPLGTLMSLGLLLGLALVGARALGREVRTERWRLAAAAGVAATMTILVGTVSGFSAMFGYFVSPNVRAWNRISVFVAFFALVVLAVALSAARDRWIGRHRPVWTAIALVPVVLWAAYEQSPNGIPQYAQNKAAWQNDARFGAAVQAALPHGAMVLQLPYMPFPEAVPPGTMVDYDHFKGYIHTSGLRFSYGASKGRFPDDWAARSGRFSDAELLATAAAAGFDAVWVDRAGYSDGGARIERRIRAVTGAGPVAVSGDRRRVLYRLDPIPERLRVVATAGERAAGRDALLRPMSFSWGAGFFPRETDGTRRWYWGTKSGVVVLTNGSGAARRLEVRARVLTPGPRRARIDVGLPGGGRSVIRTDGNDAPATLVRLRVTVPPGTSRLTFATEAPDEISDPRDLRMQFIDPVVRDLGALRLARAIAERPG